MRVSLKRKKRVVACMLQRQEKRAQTGPWHVRVVSGLAAGLQIWPDQTSFADSMRGLVSYWSGSELCGRRMFELG